MSVKMSLTFVALSLTFLMHTVAVPFESGNTSSVELVWVTNVVTSSVYVLDAATSVLVVAPAPSATPLLLSIGSAVPAPSPSVFSPPQPVTVTDISTNVVTVTFTDPPATTTVSAPPSTVTDTITVSPSSSPSTSTSSPTAQKAWAAPPQMTNLASFNVTHFADGKQNMRIISGLPANASTDAFVAFVEASAAAANISYPPEVWNGGNSSSMMQLFYPEGSINPSSQPQGGADFYAVPLDLSEARNVSLEYSVFFPVDFDWVQGGKLPGLYGGHSGCSGGNDASTCFSTRLMWRPGGAGELYLYAPKDKQTAAFCSTPPFSICDSDYGLSIGRGSFTFVPGAWTTVRQTVTLNTPGEQDGGFVLEVNGQQVITRSDAFYRDVPKAASSDSGGDGSDSSDNSGDSGGSGDDNSGPSSNSDDDGSGDSDDDGSGDSGSSDSDDSGSDDGSADDDGDEDNGGGLLGLGLGLGLYSDSLLHVKLWPGGIVLSTGDDDADGSSSVSQMSSTTTAGLVARQTVDPQTSESSSPETQTSPLTSTSTIQAAISTQTSTLTSTSIVQATLSTQIQTVTSQVTSTTTVYPTASPTLPAVVEQAAAPRPIGFTGLFFSTFFGGHEQDWASPKDQYVWFTGFSMTAND